MTAKKTLVIINGVTGAIGRDCFAEFSRNRNMTTIGLSRQARPINEFCQGKYLPDCMLIGSIGETNVENCSELAGYIQPGHYEMIWYIHAVGHYPFELDSQGEIEIKNDHNQDGVDDQVEELTYNAFFNMTNALTVNTGLPIKALTFGGIADKHQPAVHKSWWTVMTWVRGRMMATADNDRAFAILNISSVVCPNELMTRPFVFRDTNAEPCFWLKPCEVAAEVASLLAGTEGFVEANLWRPSEYHTPDYYDDRPFTDRKMRELGINLPET
jgi:hypothetical protein